ncbi:hypothetical protein C8F01DRAFT_1137178 [Mycena amicta]|nr:hypothetical protein C8F01DRAFT_1137178 [Mycena amicta]
MMSAFSSKLGTNYCPTDDEIHEINNLLLEPSHEIQHLDRKIAEIQKSLDDVVRQRTRLTEYVDAHKALLSPIRRVPLDILSEIFISCLPTERNCVMSAGEAPILLGHICSYWREIALSTPLLWASLHFVDPSSNSASTNAWRQKAQQRLDAAIIWLGRSGQCPLSISVHGPGDDSPGAPTPPPGDQLEEGPTFLFLQALLPFASQWTHLQFTMPQGNLMLFKSLGARDVPLLRSFSFNDDTMGLDTRFDWSEGSLIEWLRGSQLEQFHLKTFGFSPRHIPLRWDDLTDLDFDGTHSNAPEILVVLGRCARLISCGITVGTGDVADGPRGRVEISSLLQFKLRTGWSTSSLEFLDLLWFPNLRDFSLTANSINPNDTLDLGPISRFFTAMHELEKVSIFPDPFPDAFLIGLLQALPSTIHHLELGPLTKNISPVVPWGLWNPVRRTASSFDEILETLLPSSNGLFPLPELQTLKLVSSHTSEKAVLDFVQARKSCLKRVDVTFQNPIEVDVEAALRPFMDEGLEVVIVQPEPVNLKFSPWAGLDQTIPVNRRS